MVRAVVGAGVLFLAFGAIVSGAMVAQLAHAEHETAALPVLARRAAEKLWTNEEALSSLHVEGFSQKCQRLRFKKERRKVDRSESAAARRRRLRARRTRRRSGVGATTQWLLRKYLRMQKPSQAFFVLFGAHAMVEAKTPLEVLQAQAFCSLLSLCQSFCHHLLQYLVRSRQQPFKHMHGRSSDYVKPSAHNMCGESLVRPNPRMEFSCANNPCNSELQELGSPERKSDVAVDMVKVLQMYHVRVVSAIAQQKWRQANGIVEPSTKGDATQYWTPLIDPKKDFEDCSPAHLRRVYCRLRAAAVEAGVGGEPELDPAYWRPQLWTPNRAPVGSASVDSIPRPAPVHGVGACNSELTEHVAPQAGHIDARAVCEATKEIASACGASRVSTEEHASEDVEDLSSSPIIVEGVSQSSLRQAVTAMEEADGGEIECDEVPAQVAVAACTTSPEHIKSTIQSELLSPLRGLSELDPSYWRSQLSSRSRLP